VSAVPSVSGEVLIKEERVSTLRSSLAGQAPRLPRINSSPKAVPPANWRLAAASVTAVIVSLVADIVLAAAGQAAFTVPAAFGKFSFGSYAPLTVLGISPARTGAQ
jgi:hypothetical protein